MRVLIYWDARAHIQLKTRPRLSPVSLSLSMDRLVTPDVIIKMTSIMGQTSWAKMTSPVDKLTALACHTTKNINKAE